MWPTAVGEGNSNPTVQFSLPVLTDLSNMMWIKMLF